MKKNWKERRKILLILFLWSLPWLSLGQEGRMKQHIDFDWRFHLGDVSEASLADFDDSDWRKVDVPHDWSIEQPFSKDNPGGNGFLPGGIGWYRKTLEWDKRWKGKEVLLNFDGVFMNSEVWINGNRLGKRPFGYISFGYDIASYLKPGKNKIAVRVDNSQIPSARWYSGSGIFRHVDLIITHPVHVARHGTFVRTPTVRSTEAMVAADLHLVNRLGKVTAAKVISNIRDKNGKVVARQENAIQLNVDSTQLTQQFTLNKPLLWSPETPHTYQLETDIQIGNKQVDHYTTVFGVRKLEFDATHGFRLNGKPTKFKGVCEHESMGGLGAAIPADALHRKLKILKEMGCNAIRVGHHPFPDEFYNMCDTMGFMVMDEIFDGWLHWPGFGKAKWDYGAYFQEWWAQDLEELVKRDRNHPSIVIWCQGNEVWGFDKHLDVQKAIYDLYHRLDPTRPTTQAWATHTYLDIVGFNANGEGKDDIARFHREHPNQVAIGTEFPHTRQTRGVYRTKTSYNPWDKPDKSGHEASAANVAKLYPIPDLSEEEVFPEYDARYASGYDNQTRKISVRDAWKLVRDNNFYIGQFRWTGFDYLGEAWGWPSRTNNYGVIDLAGFPKDDYYLYQSLWTDKPMIHLLPHWNHPNKAGIPIPVVAYTNGDAAELFLNGKSLGKQALNTDQLQLLWQVPYTPGRLEAVAYKNGQEIARDTVETTGDAKQLHLSANRTQLTANRRDVVFITIDVTDTQNRLVPDRSGDTVHFEIKGPYRLLGVENGDILDMSPQQVNWRKTFMGKALLMLQATDQPGLVEVKATAVGLTPATMKFTVKNKKR
ncbi:beta-galactosidase GalB [Olivibacter ginsenosidimutans]|uniref:Beta-galactosidase GalB n=1 Tax=Olivibacter ginsenosidimutans TaxID=1176537 RepID=A0ABP9C1I6_9SPHI